ncbi:DUF3515 family protein [Microbacterium sp. NPDC091313]
MTRPRRPLAVVAVATLALALTSCAGTVSLQPGPEANDPACAELMVGLPATIGGEQRRWTDAQATAAWGSPATIIMTCGVAVPGPSTLPCRELNGIDWLVDEADAPNYRFTTFGRTPAVEVYLNFDVVGSADTLGALSARLNAVQSPTGSECTDRPDS